MQHRHRLSGAVLLSVWLTGGHRVIRKKSGRAVTQRLNQPSGWRVHEKLGGRRGSDCQGRGCGAVIRKRESAVWKWETDKGVKVCRLDVFWPGKNSVKVKGKNSKVVSLWIGVKQFSSVCLNEKIRSNTDMVVSVTSVSSDSTQRLFSGAFGVIWLEWIDFTAEFKGGCEQESHRPPLMAEETCINSPILCLII